jgi:ComF family protein
VESVGRRLTSAIRAAADSVLGVVLAPSCAACGTLLDFPTRGPVCERCWRSIPPLPPPLCDRCGDPLPGWRTTGLTLARCGRCRRGREIDRARAIGAYDGALRAIVHALKYEGRRSLAVPLAALMRARGADVLDGADWAVPVPLHPSRRRSRGFNQAADLARHLGVPLLPALRRTRVTEMQTGLPAARRRRNVRGAFDLARGRWMLPRDAARLRSLEGSTVVLVDDVCTTGATLDACAGVLKAAGARDVRAITAARVVTTRR